MLATGGIGHLYAVTTNPRGSQRPRACDRRARRRGASPTRNSCSSIPTAIAVGRDPAPLATEALRGEGATLVNGAASASCSRVHPLAELAPRDIVARGVFAEIAAGRGAFLDAREALGARFAEKFPDRLCKLHRGRHRSGDAADPGRAGGALPHGRRRRGRARPHSLDGLWAGGEVASTGAHGANRLASNSLLEAVVFAARIAEDIAVSGSPAPARLPAAAVVPRNRADARASERDLRAMMTRMSA